MRVLEYIQIYFRLTLEVNVIQIMESLLLSANALDFITIKLLSTRYSNLLSRQQ